MKRKGCTSSLMRVMLAVCVLFPVTGCEKFVKTETENLAPFANQTIDFIGSLEYSLTDSEILYLRNIADYIEEEDPYRRYSALEEQVGNMLIAVVTYSLQIVTISEQDISDNGKANLIADVVVALIELVRKDEVVVNPNRDDEKIDAIVAQVRQ